MGLGDVHLQAAVGAALGWKVAVLAFFVAVFVAITWSVASLLLRRFSRFFNREIPFGPHLAVGAILFVVARGAVVGGLDGFSTILDRGVRALTGLELAPTEKAEKSLPAQLAQPRDQL
jgi:hypothetical protein